MANQYSAKYLKIYLWQGISLVLNFLSMFIVIPFLTKEPAIYGIYAVCISISIFFTYADLGFMSAGQKYAAECFARGERENEIRIIGFISFILFAFVLMIMVVFLYLGFNPQSLLKNLDTAEKISIASKLLIVLALFAPINILQRMSQLIFGIRLDDFLYQRISSIANLFKILSVFYFFRNDKYLIVEYFLFSQIINLLASVISLLYAKKKYNYNFKLLLNSFRFDLAIYKKMNKLAFSSLFLTIMWILYYELDSIAIGKFLGSEKVAIYAIGLTIMSFFRGILGIVFSPFSARFNHFIGENNGEGLKNFSLQVVKLTAPLVVIPIIALTVVAKPLVLSWVGADYLESINIVFFLLLCNVFAFIAYPVSMLLMANEKIKEMYIFNGVIPFIYWGGIFISYNFLGLQSFAIFKLVAFLIPVSYYVLYFIRFLKMSIVNFLKIVILPLVIPLVFLITSLMIIVEYLPGEKSKVNFLTVACITGLVVVGSFILQYWVSPEIRKTGRILLKSLK